MWGRVWGRGVWGKERTWESFLDFWKIIALFAMRGETRGREYGMEGMASGGIKFQMPWNIHTKRGTWQLYTHIWRARQIGPREVNVESLDSQMPCVSFKLQAKGWAEYSVSILCFVFCGNTEASHFQTAMKPTISLLGNYSQVKRNGLWACNVLQSSLSLIYG